MLFFHQNKPQTAKLIFSGVWNIYAEIHKKTTSKVKKVFSHKFEPNTAKHFSGVLKHFCGNC